MKRKYELTYENNNTIIKGIDDFDIGQTLECGQCFHFYKIGKDDYLVVAYGKLLHISQNGKNVTFHDTTIEEYDEIWADYFDLDRDYGEIKRYLLNKDEILDPAIEKKWGVRILNQEFSETLMSFIISQTKQIPQIKQVVNDISRKYGKYVGEYNGEKYDVVAIGGNAFYFCYDLTSITIPSSIIRIGGGAFTNCTGLTTVNINDIAAWCQIEFVDYYSTPFNFAEKMYLNGELLVNLVIPDGVKEIKQYAFYKNKNIAGVVIPNSVIGIVYKAFLGCSGIESVIIGNCVEKIGDYAFHGCSKMSD